LGVVFRGAGAGVDDAFHDQGGAKAQDAWEGVSGLNPKALLLFLAFLLQFLTHRAAWPFTAQISLLGLVHTANCAVVYTSVGATAGRVMRTRPTAATAVTRCSGAAMIAIGALLLAEHLLTRLLSR
jgi:threonine/homoserine/homoserine lactone efflux protein